MGVTVVDSTTAVRGPARGDDRGEAATRRRASFPWYDSIWLAKYVRAKAILAERYPLRLPEFEEACSVFRTDPGFRPVYLDRVFDPDVMARIRATIEGYTLRQYELHELAKFGRLVVHDDPYFIELQRNLVQTVSGLVGEAVDTSYNFLSLYQGPAACPIHMDAPSAKWTLDICINQSRKWPLRFSEITPWPETWTMPDDGAWSDEIKARHAFDSHSMDVGGAVIFGGSSQWHYRDPMPDVTTQDFCTLLFFHFIPAGTAHLAEPNNWSDLFGAPELSEI